MDEQELGEGGGLKFDFPSRQGYATVMATINRIEINPNIMLGKPVIKGTRIPVYVILNLFAEGYTSKDIQKEYPDLTKEDITAALQFASLMTRFEEFRRGTNRLMRICLRNSPQPCGGFRMTHMQSGR